MKSHFFSKNNTIKDFSELENERKQYFKYKMIEVIKIQEQFRNDLKKEREIFEEQQNLFKENEKRESDKREREKREKEKILSKNEGDNMRLTKDDTTNLKFSNNFMEKYVNLESINALENNIKHSPLINPVLKNLCKKRIGQISFDDIQCQAVIKELQSIFIPELLPTVYYTIYEQSKHQISNHLESYKLYSLILFKILNCNSVFMFFLKKQFFLKNHSENVFKGLTLVYLGYLKISNQLNEAMSFLEEAISNDNIFSLIVMECFLIVFDNTKIFDRQFLIKITDTCKNRVFGKVHTESIKSRLTHLFSLI